MFTGIVEHVGTVVSCVHGDGGTALTVDLGPLITDAKLGDSISVSGACLTITRIAGSHADFDVSHETRRKTTIAGWSAGRAVNLERALAFGARLGGHLVTGHIDGVGRLVERRADGTSERFTFVLPDGGAVKAVEKGSIAVDGVSLTTWDCRGARLSIAVIPHTLANTTFRHLRAGDPVNLEQDVIGRWVEKMLEDRR